MHIVSIICCNKTATLRPYMVYNVVNVGSNKYFLQIKFLKVRRDRYRTLKF